MKLKPLAAFEQWDDYGFRQIEIGRRSQMETAEELFEVSRAFAKIPVIRRIVVRPRRDGFSVEPAAGEPTDQLALGRLLRSVRSPGWRVVNARSRFDPRMAARIWRLLGTGPLRFRNSWMRLEVPKSFDISREGQTYPAAVDHMLEKLGGQDKEMDPAEFSSLSIPCIAKALPRDQVARYFVDMR